MFVVILVEIFLILSNGSSRSRMRCSIWCFFCSWSFKKVSDIIILLFWGRASIFSC